MPVISPLTYIRKYILDMTQDELATKLGIAQPNVSKLERAADRKIPEHHRKVLRRLAKSRGKRIKDEWYERAPLTETV